MTADNVLQFSAPSQGAPGNPVWFRQKSDTDRSWEAFLVYRDMGPARSLRKVSEQMHKVDQLVRRWSVDHNWRSRVLAFDQDKDRERQERLAAMKDTIAEQQATIAQGFTQKTLQALALVRPADLAADPGVLLKYFTEVAKLQRVLYGFGESADAQMIQNIIIDGSLLHGPTVLPPEPETVDADDFE